ncbi:hypothetical protein SDC9_166467 [bioreactor metagenome]|uniref:Uncharacterized protein n=1 Tax=bioreactor metagenome TaxID=1076179 RepID=A0A645FX01_9ZZZZ
MQSRQIFSAIPQQRHSLFGEVSKYQLTRFTRVNRLQRFGVNNFRKEMVFIQVRTVLAFAFVPHSRSGNFTQPVNIIRLDTQLLFNLFTHAFRPRFRTENADLQFKIFTGYARIFDRIGYKKSVRRRTAQNCRAKIMHQRNLFFCITTRHGNNRCTDILGSVMSTQSPGKQTVTVSDMKYVRIAGTVSRKAA